MKPTKIKAKATEYLPMARGIANWTMRQIKASANIAVAGGGAVVSTAGKVVSVVNIPFVIFEMVQLAKEIPHLKGRVKALPLVAIFGKADDLLFAANVIKDAIAEAIVKGSSLTPSLLAASTALSVAATGLIALSILMESIGIHSLSKQKNKFQKLLKEEGESSAIQFLTKTRSEIKGKRRLFNAFSAKQTERISQFFNSAKTLPEQKTEVLEKIKRRYSYLKKSKAIGIAIATITIVGVLLLCFLPTPLAPVAWSVIGLSGLLATIRFVHYRIANRRFNNMLKNAQLST